MCILAITWGISDFCPVFVLSYTTVVGKKSMREKEKKKKTSKPSSYLGSGWVFTFWGAFQDFSSVSVVHPEETKSRCSVGTRSSVEVKARGLVTRAVTWDPALPFSSEWVTLLKKMTLLEQCSSGKSWSWAKETQLYVDFCFHKLTEEWHATLVHMWLN